MIIKYLKLSSLFVISLFVVECSHYPNVRPSSKGLHSVVIKTDLRDEGYSDAFEEASSYCDDVLDQNAQVVDEEWVYKNEKISEEEYLKYKNTSKLVGGVSKLGVMFGDKKTKKSSSLGLGASMTANDYFSKGYSYKLQFECQ